MIKTQVGIYGLAKTVGIFATSSNPVSISLPKGSTSSFSHPSPLGICCLVSVLEVNAQVMEIPWIGKETFLEQRIPKNAVKKYNSTLGNSSFPEITKKTWHKWDALRELQPRIPIPFGPFNAFFSLYLSFILGPTQRHFVCP